jgi:hypothetical protein
MWNSRGVKYGTPIKRLQKYQCQTLLLQSYVTTAWLYGVKSDRNFNYEFVSALKFKNPCIVI